MFILDHDQNKINQPNQCLEEKWNHVMPPPAYTHSILIRWRSLWMLYKMNHCRYVYPNTRGISDTVYHSCRKHGSGEVFFLYKTDWLRNSMLTDLLGDLVSIAVHGHTMLISITVICNNYMRNHPCSIHWDFYSDIWYFTKFKSEY